MAFELRNARVLASEAMARIVNPGDTAVDATMGNGKDTLALAELVGETGHVYAFDVQQLAVQRTRERLRAAGCEARATLLCAGHEHMADYVRAPVRMALFNLGWLPGADKGVTTRAETTLCAVQAALALLAVGGVVSVCVYPGHAEGRRELEAMRAWCASLVPQTYSVLHQAFLNHPKDPPQLFLIQRQG